jgi:hypothetical protein
MPAAPASRRSFVAAAARALAIVGLGALCTCDNIDNFDVEVSGKGVVPKGTIVDELLGALALDGFQSIDLSNELKNQGVTKDDVDSVRLVSLTVRIEGPPEATFDFLDSVTFYVETQGQPKTVIATLTAVPAGAKEISLTVDPNVELKPYVVAPSMKMTGEVNGKRPDQDTQVAADVVLDVDVTVPGC